MTQRFVVCVFVCLSVCVCVYVCVRVCPSVCLTLIIGMSVSSGSSNHLWQRCQSNDNKLGLEPPVTKYATEHYQATADITAGHQINRLKLICLSVYLILGLLSVSYQLVDAAAAWRRGYSHITQVCAIKKKTDSIYLHLNV